MPAFAGAVRQTILARSGGRCESCGSAAQHLGFSVHHRRPRGMGGSRREHTNCTCNAFVLCGSGVTGCHGFYESNRTLAKEQGVIVRQVEEPWNVPILRRGQVVRLDCAGQVQAA